MTVSLGVAETFARLAEFFESKIIYDGKLDEADAEPLSHEEVARCLELLEEVTVREQGFIAPVTANFAGHKSLRVSNANYQTDQTPIKKQIRELLMEIEEHRYVDQAVAHKHEHAVAHKHEHAMAHEHEHAMAHEHEQTMAHEHEGSKSPGRTNPPFPDQITNEPRSGLVHEHATILPQPPTIMVTRTAKTILDALNNRDAMSIDTTSKQDAIPAGTNDRDTMSIDTSKQDAIPIGTNTNIPQQPLSNDAITFDHSKPSQLPEFSFDIGAYSATPSTRQQYADEQLPVFSFE